MDFRGLFPILQTPFNYHGEVDFDSFRREIRHVRAQGVQGIVFPGFVSEWWRLTDSEIMECASFIGESAVLNVTAQATAPAVRTAREFARLGASALMMLPPFVVPAPVERHIAAVLAATDLPCVLQDSAGLTGVRLHAASLARLAREHSNFRAIKVDQTPTGPAISVLRSESDLESLSFLVGYAGVQMLDAVRRGASGLMGGCGHLPEDRRMVDALLSGDGYHEYTRLLPLLNFEMQTIDMATSVHKQLLFEQGIFSTPVCRAPCGGLDPLHQEELHLHMESLRGGSGTTRL